MLRVICADGTEKHRINLCQWVDSLVMPPSLSQIYGMALDASLPMDRTVLLIMALGTCRGRIAACSAHRVASREDGCGRWPRASLVAPLVTWILP